MRISDLEQLRVAWSYCTHCHFSVCQESVPLSLLPAAAYTVNSSQDLSCCLRHVEALPSGWSTRIKGSSAAIAIAWQCFGMCWSTMGGSVVCTWARRTSAVHCRRTHDIKLLHLRRYIRKPNILSPVWTFCTVSEKLNLTIRCAEIF